MPFTGVNPAPDVAVAFANSACSDSACKTDAAGFADVLHILTATGAVDGTTARRLLKNYEDSPKAQDAAAAALAFRDVISRSLQARMRGTPVPARTLAQINDALFACRCSREVVADAEGYRVLPVFDISEPADVLMPLAHGIAEILASVDPTRIKQCREPRCTCYFIDTSKNRTRTWCSMQRCGNRQKVANYYRRSHQPVLPQGEPVK